MPLRCTCCSIAIATAALATSAAVQARTVLTALSWPPLTHALTATQRDWRAQLARKTASRAKDNILPQTVTAPPRTFDNERNGLADLSYTVQGYTPGRFVSNQMDELPYLGNPSESLSATFAGAP